jgi:hypothetical protein
MKTILAGAVFSSVAAAQCSMCRTAVQGDAAARTFDHAVLILLIPAVGLFCGIFIGIFRGSSDRHE